MTISGNGTHVGVDLGTGSTKVSGTYRMNGQCMMPRDFLLLHDERTVPAVVAYHGTPKKIYRGKILLGMLAIGNMPAEKVIQQQRLALSKALT